MLQTLGVYWTDEYEMGVKKEAAERLIAKHEELEEFCARVRRRHNETSENVMEGRESWRDFRSFVVQDMFDREFDRDELYDGLRAELVNLSSG